MRQSVLVVGILLVAGSCGTDGESTTNSSAISPTTGISTASSTQSTTTTVASDEGFQPSCVETTNDPPRFAFANETALDTFGPLGTTPSLQITLPLGFSTMLDGPQPPALRVNRIPGGVLLSARADYYEQLGGSLLAAINADGSTRWVRCYHERVAQLIVASASTNPTIALVGWDASLSAATTAVAWSTFDLESGDLEPSDLDPESWPLATSADHVLLGPSSFDGVDVAQRHMTLVDLRTARGDNALAAARIPFPAEFSDRTAYPYPEFGVTDAGDVAIGVRDERGFWSPVSAYRDGGWTNDASVLGDTPPVRVGETYNGTYQLVGFAPDGTEEWSVPDIQLASREALTYRSTGSVTVAVGCEVAECASAGPYDMYGIATATGRRIWKLDGFDNILVIGDGYALVTGIDGQRAVIDVNTGELPEPSQEWSSNSYGQGCCDEYALWVALFGGVVVAVVGQHVDVWYPADVAPETHRVTIP